MNILLIDHYAGSPELGMEFRPYYMARQWVKSGHHVLIVGATYSHLRRKQPTVGGQNIDGVDYYWVKTNIYKGNGIGRILSMFVFVIKIIFFSKSICKSFRPDAVIASSTYPLDIYPARKIAKKYGAKLIYEVHDLWPLSPMEIGGYSKWHPFIMVMQRAENYAYKCSDRVVSLLPNALQHMVEHGLDKKKFIYVPNGFDLSEWDKRVQLSTYHVECINNLHKKGFWILGYAGGHAKSNALDYLIDAVQLVKNSKIVCVMVGNGQEKERLQKRIIDEKINNVYFLPPVSKKEIPALLELMDGLYIGWEKNPLYRFGIAPNKLIDYMMAGKPIIHSVNAANDWVQDAGCGISVDAENAVAVAEAIEQMSKWDLQTCQVKGLLGKSFVSEKLTYSVLAKQFLDNILREKD